MKKKSVIFGMVGIKLDHGFKEVRHRQWRPTIAIAKQSIKFDRMELWFQPNAREAGRLKETIKKDLSSIKLVGDSLESGKILGTNILEYRGTWVQIEETSL